jgi:anaerobic C4-dicarboxylate transporter
MIAVSRGQVLQRMREMAQPESKAKETWTAVWVFLVVVVFIALILIVGTGLPRYGAETEFAGVSIIKTGKPPAMPGRHAEFDSSGSRCRTSLW